MQNTMRCYIWHKYYNQLIKKKTIDLLVAILMTKKIVHSYPVYAALNNGVLKRTAEMRLEVKSF